MNAKPFEELLQGYLDGSLTEAECRELAQDLAASEVHRAELVHHRLLDALLSQLGEPALDKDLILRALSDTASRDLKQTVNNRIGNGEIVRFPPRRQRWWLSVPLAAAASLALVVGGWWLAQGREPAGLGLRVVEVAGTATIEDGRWKMEDLKSGTQSQESMVYSPKSKVPAKPAVVGMELRQGDRVVVAQGGKIGLKYDSEETTIGLDGTATFEKREGGKFVRLEPGRFTCSAAPQTKPFRIQSPHALSTVVGTRFNIEVFDAKTALVVSEGKVQFERDGQTLLVGSNQTAEASDQGLKMLPPAAPRSLTTTVIRKFLPYWPSGSRSRDSGISSSSSGIAFDGNVLWVNSTGARALLKLDPMTGAVIGRLDYNTIFAPSEFMHGLAWDGTRLWGSVHQYPDRKTPLRAVDPGAGRLVASLNPPADFSYVNGVAVGGGYLWCQGLGSANQLVRKVAKLDPSSGAVAACWEVPKEVRSADRSNSPDDFGLAYMNDAIWLVGAEGTKVFKVNPADGTVLGWFDTPELDPQDKARRTRTVTMNPVDGTLIENTQDRDRVIGLAKGATAGQLWMAGLYGGVYLVEVGEGIEN